MDCNVHTLYCTTERKVTEIKDKDGNKKKRTSYDYNAKVIVTLTSHNLKTNKKFSHDFTGHGSSISSSEDAIGYALMDLRNEIARRYNMSYPVMGHIVEVAATNKAGKWKRVIVDVGSAERIYTDQELNFIVKLYETPGDDDSARKIGRVKLLEVQGPHRCLCKVKEGADDIKAYMEANADILLVSTEETFGWLY